MTRSLAAALCGLLAASLPARAAEEHALLAIPGTNVLFLVQYVAADEKLWEKEGLDVTVQYINGIGAMNAVIAGSADFSMSSGPSITRANSRGQKLIALATAIEQSGQGIVIRKEIADAEHFDPKAPLAVRAKILKGRTFATGATAAIPDVIFKVVAKEAGIAPNEITTAPMQPPEFMAAFARKAIDGFSNSPPYLQQVVLDGTGVMVIDPAKGEPEQYAPVASALLLARRDFCASHRSVCTKMVHGVAAATQLIRERPAEALAVMKAHFGTYDDRVLAASLQMVQAMTPSPPITTPKELENGDLLNEAAGFIKPEEKLADYAAIIDNSFFK